MNLPNEQVVRDVVKVTTILEPLTGSTDVVSGALALGLGVKQVKHLSKAIIDYHFYHSFFSVMIF